MTSWVRPAVRHRRAALLGVVVTTVFCAAVESAVVPSRAMANPSVFQVQSAPAYLWPLAGLPRVVRAFDPPPKPWLPGHRGVDLAAAPRERVYAAGAGTVAFAGTVAGVGVVSIAHPGGLRTTYEPVTASVHVGATIEAGTPIGTISGDWTHCPSGVPACLHWGLIRGEHYLDPLSLLVLDEVRLLPTAAAPPQLRARGPTA